MESTHSPPHNLSFALRIAVWGGDLVASIGYAVLIPMKMLELLPPEMTWIRLILGPAFMVTLVPAHILAAMWFPKRVICAFWIVTVVGGIAVLIIMLLDSGFHASRP